MSGKADKSSMTAAQRIDNLQIDDGQYHLTLGILYCQFGYWSNALGCFRSALESFGNVQNLYPMGKSLILFGNTQACLGQHQAAGRSYQRAVYTFSRVGSRCETVYALRKLGLTRYWSGYLRASVRLLEQASLYCEHGDCPYEEALTLLGLGRLYCEQKKYAFALSCYESASDIFESFPQSAQMIRYKAAIQEATGQVFECTNHLELSVKHYVEALVLYEKLQLVEVMGQMCYRLARIYERLGQSMTAFHYQKHANSLIFL